MATAIEIAKEFFPDANDTQIDHIIWERTGYPCFWPDRNKTVEENFRMQLSEFKEALKLGVPLCDFCNRPAVIRDLCEHCVWFLMWERR